LANSAKFSDVPNSHPIPNARTVLCPSCRTAMTLARTTPRLGGMPELRSFECKSCGTILTEAVDNRSSPPRGAKGGSQNDAK